MARSIKAAANEAAPVTVPMTRDPEFHPAPHRAEVHPDEVALWQAAGWAVEA